MPVDRSVRFPLVCSLLLLSLANSYSQVGKGFQILINRGFQVQGMVTDGDVFHLNTYSNAYYTSINWLFESDPSRMGTAPGYPWGRWVSDETNMPPIGSEAPFLSTLVSLQLADEWNLNDDAVRNRAVAWFNSVSNDWPNTILLANNYGGQVGDSQLIDFVNRAHPDLISFDNYPWHSQWTSATSNHIGSVLGGPPIPWYGELRRYRDISRAFNIPFGSYVQTFHAVQDYDQTVYRDPSPSELRLNHFGALAFTAKTLIDFTYNTGASSLFTKPGGDTYPTALFTEKTNAAWRVRNFGKALVRLRSADDVTAYTTSVMFIRGRDANGNLYTLPINFLADPEEPDKYTDWAYQRYDPYLTNNWTVTNKGTKNNGQPGDVIISWLKPLDESFDGPDYTNEVYLIVVNGLTDPTGTAADCAQEIRLNFRDQFLAVEMLNPQTGLVQVQPLPLTNGFRQLVLNLDGGDAALFKFSDGAPFVGTQVFGPPIMTRQPSNRTNNAGTTASFSALVAGSAPLYYQWQFSGTNIAGATTNTFSRASVQAIDSGNYRLLATNSLGSVTSAVAALTVNSAPQITAQPQSQSVSAGISVVFHVTAVGVPVPSYQWQFNGSPIYGATTSSYMRANVQSLDAGNYSVIVSNSLGSILSSNAALTVTGAPCILGQPQNKSVLAGSPASFTVTAVGTAPLSYQWRKNGTPIANGGNVSGATTSALSIANVQSADQGTYNVTVNNAYGGITSMGATLSIATQPVIQVQPVSITNNFGTSATFSVVAAGNELAYQWQRDGTNLADAHNIYGSSSARLLLDHVTRLDAASYSVVITNAAGSVTSSAATLTVVFALPLLEPFDYSIPNNLGGLTSPDLLAWADVGTSTAGPFITIQSNNLVVPGLVPSTGNGILFGGLGKSARLSFQSGKPYTNGTLYYSFALKVLDLTGANSSGGFIAGLNNSVGTQTAQPSVVGTRLYLRTAGDGFNLGVAKNSSTTTDWVWDNTIYLSNQTIFVVGSYTFTTVAVTNDDISKLWINPNPADFGAANPPTPTLVAPLGADITANSIASFVFFQRSATIEPAAMIADELRIDTTWAGVTPKFPAQPTLSLTFQGATPVPTVQGSLGGRYQLEYSPSIPAANWIPLTNLWLPRSPYQFFDSATTISGARYYRVFGIP